jgi:hypothetical protein
VCVTPGVGIDVDTVAMLCESVDEGDLLAGKLEDANARWMPPHARRLAVGEAERLLEQNPWAADEVSNAKKALAGC